MITLRNKFDSLLIEISETHNPNEEYENFVNTRMESSAECKQSNQEPNTVFDGRHKQ